MSEAPKRVRKPKTEWHLICITRKGKVSVLKNLDLYTARETYKKLMPDTRPRKYLLPDCNIRGWQSMGYLCSSSDGDNLKNVEVIGPEGAELDPWLGVEPLVIDERKRHKADVAHGSVTCDCTDKLEGRAPWPQKADLIEDLGDTDEDPEDARLRRLHKEVPTAFWLETAHA